MQTEWKTIIGLVGATFHVVYLFADFLLVCKRLIYYKTESHFLFECHNYIEGRNYMHNFIQDTSYSSQLQKLEYLFKIGELSSLNSIGKYIFESFKSRDKQS